MVADTRVDYNFNDNNKLFVRFKNDRGFQPTFTDPINPIFNIQSNQPEDEGQVNYTHVFSPNVVNNFVGSILCTRLFFRAPINKRHSTLSVYACCWRHQHERAGSGGNDALGNTFFPQGRNVTQWQLVDDLSIARGKHTFKLGVNFRRDDVSDFTAGN